jgi:hypothetical protein
VLTRLSESDKAMIMGALKDRGIGDPDLEEAHLTKLARDTQAMLKRPVIRAAIGVVAGALMERGYLRYEQVRSLLGI